jgi:mRNA interferase MazF
MRRGEVWAVGDPNSLRYRIVVLSADRYNDRPNAVPLCAPIVRRQGSSELPPFVVPLAELDPLTGVVVVSRVRRIPASAGAERLGMVTGATMVRLGQALRDLFEV